MPDQPHSPAKGATPRRRASAPFRIDGDATDRRRALMHYLWRDHAILRQGWSNFGEIAPGIYRSNQPTRRRFEAYARMGIRTVINLRGREGFPHFLFAEESCADFGLTLIVAKLRARRASTTEHILGVIDALRQAEPPMLLHCKSGADRTGLAAAIYILAIAGGTVDEARRQLTPRYLHFRSTATGIQDYIIEVYAAAAARSGIGFEDWVRRVYDWEEVQAGFDARRSAGDTAARLDDTSGAKPS
ncbi:phosphatase domain-containing protein [Litorisediminicola beolgyonensis]|uniref:Tyrosine-protein phosphatase n=1 Tax=Litorisediminicola beolgyonensis TaxID=1173614 RepID=A0ABW3ZFE9_9RHOB